MQITSVGQVDVMTSAKMRDVLDASADGIMLLEAVRDNNNEVINFRLSHCNKAAFTLGKISPAFIGKTLLEILPHLHRSEQFQLHKKVVETGVPVRMETTFRDKDGKEYGWFIVSLMKTGDSVVSTFTDISEKKANETKINEQAELLNSIFEASINAIFACEAIRNAENEIVNLKILKINSAFTSLLQIPAVTAENKMYLDIFPLAKEYGFYEFYTSVIVTGSSQRKELYYDDGMVRGWYDVSAVKQGNNNVVITFTDVSENKKNKEALEDAAQYMQTVIDSSQTGIILLEPVRNTTHEITDFRFKAANRTVAAYLAKEPADIIGKLHSETFPDSENFLIKKYIAIAESEENEQRFENHYAANGTEVWLDVLVKKRGEDLLITFHDFSPLKKLQVGVTEAAKKLSAVINTSQAGMFTLIPVFDDKGEIEDFRFGIVNQAVGSYIGEPAENVKGNLGSKHFPAYKTNGLFDIFKDTFLTNKQHRFDFHYEDGYDKYFNIHTVKAGDELLVTFTDHTSLKKLQLQLQASVEELKHSNSNLEEFAYAASHDLQEPLRKIHYFSERLRKSIVSKISEDEVKMFERIENATKRMSQLISDLLVYSQVTSKIEAFKPVDLAQVLHQVIADFDTLITEKNAVITVDEMPKILGDYVQLTQLFQNLIGNSLKYSKTDTPPVITISAGIVLRGSNGGTNPYHEIIIRDNGIGFEPQHAERIFKIFQRLHGQNEFPGTGIGLAIVNKVIDNHGGLITAEGQPGEGATFTVLFPVPDRKMQ